MNKIMVRMYEEALRLKMSWLSQRCALPVRVRCQWDESGYARQLSRTLTQRAMMIAKLEEECELIFSNIKDGK